MRGGWGYGCPDRWPPVGFARVVAVVKIRRVVAVTRLVAGATECHLETYSVEELGSFRAPWVGRKIDLTDCFRIKDLTYVKGSGTPKNTARGGGREFFNRFDPDQTLSHCTQSSPSVAEHD